MKLIFLNRFFHPDHSATSQILSDLAFALAERGKKVCVITGRQRYDAPKHVLPTRETIAGVAVHRVWASRFGRTNLSGRAVDYATFYMSAAWRLWCLAERGDVVIAKTDPPMVSVIAAGVCWLRGARLINWLQDIFPETAQNLGVGGRAATLAYGLMRRLRNRSLMAAHMNVVLGKRMAERVLSFDIPSDRVRIVHNWADGSAVTPLSHEANALRGEWELGDAFVVAYSGNLGRAHDVETVLDAMQLVAAAGDPAMPATSKSAYRSVLWLFIGDGALFGHLKAEVARRGFTSVRFKPYQPRALLAKSLSAGDVHLISLRPELEGLIVPSKFYGIAAVGRPTLFIGDVNGEIAELVARYQCGRTVAIGNAAQLAQTVLELARDEGQCRLMGKHAREAFEAEFDKPLAIARWEALLGEISGKPVPEFQRSPGGHNAGRSTS